MSNVRNEAENFTTAHHEMDAGGQGQRARGALKSHAGACMHAELRGPGPETNGLGIFHG